MPVRKVKGGYRYGKTGKVYKSKAKAEWLTDTLIRYYYIQAWDGKLPNYYMGSDSDILLSVPVE